MLRRLWIGTCLAVALAGCISEPHNPGTKAVNTALTGAACLVVARRFPCIIEPPESDKSTATEARAAAVRTQAQRDSTAADQEAARRSSCLADVGPRLPVSSSECATYATTRSGNELR